MRFLSRMWAQIRLFLAEMPTNTKLLIAALVVVLVLVGCLVLLYAGAPELVPIQVAGTQSGEVLNQLKKAGIPAQSRGGQVLVPADQVEPAFAALAEVNLADDSLWAAVEKTLAQQTPWMSNAQNAQAAQLARERMLSRIVSRMTGVQSAHVLLAPADEQGFGRTRATPTASVLVTMKGSQTVEKPLVHAIAGLVAGASGRGLRPEDVAITDARRGVLLSVKSGPEAMLGGIQEAKVRATEDLRATIQTVLSHIPGVIVGVNVQVDPTAYSEVDTREFEKNDRLKTTESTETSRRGGGEGGEAGVRPNVGANGGADVTATAATASTETTNKTREDFFEPKESTRTRSTKVGHTVNRVSAIVNVPRSYFVAIFRAGKADAADPDDAALQPVLQKELATIEKQVKTLVSTTDPQGMVLANMYPDRGVLSGGAGPGAPATAAATPAVLALLDGNWVKPVGLGMLAMLSLALMFGMVRKATQRPPLPSAEELAGVPPTLPADDDLVGEAEEGDASMAGVELDEDELRHRKITEQIAQLIKDNPQEAATLVRRWVRTEE